MINQTTMKLEQVVDGIGRISPDAKAIRLGMWGSPINEAGVSPYSARFIGLTTTIRRRSLACGVDIKHPQIST